MIFIIFFQHLTLLIMIRVDASGQIYDLPLMKEDFKSLICFLECFILLILNTAL